MKRLRFCASTPVARVTKYDDRSRHLGKRLPDGVGMRPFRLPDSHPALSWHRLMAATPPAPLCLLVGLIPHADATISVRFYLTQKRRASGEYAIVAAGNYRHLSSWFDEDNLEPRWPPTLLHATMLSRPMAREARCVQRPGWGCRDGGIWDTW